MKIINRTEFLSLPEGTVFAKYSPCTSGPLSIKGETWGPDFLCTQLDVTSSDLIDCESSEDWRDKWESMENGGEVPIADEVCCNRDGFYDEDQLFVILNPDDVLKLTRLLAATIGCRVAVPTGIDRTRGEA